MKKFFGILLMLALIAPVFAEDQSTVPNKKIEFVPYFIGIGFAFAGGGTEKYSVTELHILKTKESKLDSSTPEMEKNIKTDFIFGAEKLTVKIIKLDLENFEADILKVKEESEKKNQIVIPIGHLSLKLQKPDAKHPVMAGRLMIKFEDDPDKSGEYRVMFNDITPPPPKATEGGDAGSGTTSSGNAQNSNTTNTTNSTSSSSGS